jgi:predicted transcriptional regulator
MHKPISHFGGSDLVPHTANLGDMDLNTAVGRVLKTRYRERDLLLEDVAARAGIPYSTLRKKLAGDSPIFASEVVVLTEAIGAMSDRPIKDGAAGVIETAIDLFGGIDRVMSEVRSTTDELATKRKQREAAAMPIGSLEEQDQIAATRDQELDTDEPDAP